MIEESSPDVIASVQTNPSHTQIHHIDETQTSFLEKMEPIDNRSKNPDIRLSNEFVRRAQKMCLLELYPVGSIVSSHLVVLQIKSILDALGSTSVTDDSEASVNAAIGLLGRLSREPLTPSSSSAASEILIGLHPDYYNRIFDKWKEAALRGDKVLSATSLTQFLLDNAILSNRPNNIESLGLTEAPSSIPATKTWKFIQYDMATISMIMQVAAKQAPALLAPDVVQQIWNQLDLYKSSSADSNIVYCYNALLKAWASSGAEESAMKMEWILNDMINVQKVKPNVQSYHILLSFYRRLSNLPAMERVMQSMVSPASNDVRPNISCWSEVLYCHLGQAMQPNTMQRHQSLVSIHKAQHILQLEMIANLNREDSTDMAVVATCIQALITTYRDVLSKYRFDTYVDWQKRPSSLKSGGKQLTQQERMKHDETRNGIFASAESMFSSKYPLVTFPSQAGGEQSTHPERTNQTTPEMRIHDETRDRTMASAEAFFRYMQGNKHALSGTSFRKLIFLLDDSSFFETDSLFVL
jgi:hypothetical protein